jgi:hypothetical protein
MDYNHKRILRIRLLLIERHLRDIISELKSDSSDFTFILYSIRNNISPDVIIKILNTVDSMLDEIRLMKDKFTLESEEKSVRQSIMGHLNVIWTTLEDTRPEKMSGYGRMSDHDKESLSPHILKLLLMYEDIFRCIR